MRTIQQVSIRVEVQAEAGEEQVAELIAALSHVRVVQDVLGNWVADLVDHGGAMIERLCYQNPAPQDINGDEDGPVGVALPWNPVPPGDNEADLRISPEWGSAATGLLREIALQVHDVLVREMRDRCDRCFRTNHCVIVARSEDPTIDNLTQASADDPALVPILRDKWRETLP